MAASRTVTLNVIGNSTGAQAALKAVGDHSEAQAGRMGKAFTGVLGMLNSTGVLGPFGEALNKITESVDGLGEHGKAAGAKLMAIGGAGLGVGAMFTALGDKDKAASQQLRASVEGIGESWDASKDKLESNIKFAEKYGDSAKTTQDALAILTTGLHSSTKATGDFGVVLDLAAKRHESLTQAATDWVKINEGKGTKILATLGLAHANTAKDVKALDAAQRQATAADDAAVKAKQHLADIIDLQHGKTKLTEADHIALRNAQDAVTVASEKATAAHEKLTHAQGANAASASQMTDMQRVSMVTQGQADAQANTFTGHIKALTTHIEDQAAKMGQKYGPALMGISSGVGILGGATEAVSGIMGKFKTAQEASTVATEGLAAAEDTEAASSTLALGPILLIVGAAIAVGVAIYELWTHWSEIWGWIKGVIVGVWDWIKNNWPLLLAILTGPIGLAVLAIRDHWDSIVGFVKGIPGRIADAAAGMWDGIKDAFKSAINWIIDHWNSLHFGLPSIDTHIPGIGKIGGWDVGVPQIPRFAEGGMVPGPTGAAMLAIVHGGETVTPAGAGGGSTIGALTFNIYQANDPAAVRDEVLRIIRRNVNGGLG